jgi:hypothetical protein
MLTFTTLLGGICAFVIDSDEHAKEVNASKGPIPAVSHYPAVTVGAVVRGECKVQLVLDDGLETPRLPIAFQAHAFRVEVRGTTVTLWIDNDMSFTFPRTNT